MLLNYEYGAALHVKSNIPKQIQTGCSILMSHMTNHIDVVELAKEQIRQSSYNLYIPPVWEFLKETCVKELMWSIDQLLSFPALTREPITGTLYWEARQRRIERKINMETFCDQREREKMLNKILDALCCQFLQDRWVNNSVFKTVIRRRWWHYIRFFSS